MSETAGAETASAAAETVSFRAETAAVGSAWAGAPAADVGELAAVTGERHAGFVSVVDGVAGFAPGDGVLALDEASWPDRDDLSNPGRAKPAPVSSRAMEAAATEDVLSFSEAGSVSAGVPDTVPAGATTGSGAEAPSGLASMSARPLPCGRDSLGGGTAAFGTVTSERLASGGFARDGGSASAREESGSGDESAAEDEPCAVEEPAADPPLVLPWTVVAASAAAFEPASSASRDFLPDSVCAAFDFRTVLSSSAAASVASSATSATWSAWLSTRPPQNLLATTLSAASYAWALTARSLTIVTPCQTSQLAE